MEVKTPLESIPWEVSGVGNDVPGQSHSHVLVGQQTVPVIKEIIPTQTPD